MVSVVPLVGCFVAAVVSAVVYADAVRRDLSPRTRLLWASSAGAVSFGGFAIPYLFADSLHRLYLTRVKSTPVVTSPYEMLVLHLAVGIALGAISVLLYGFGSRYVPLGRR